MKKYILTAIIAMALMPLTAFADSFSSLWKQVDEAQRKDLPRTQLAILDKIITKAKAERAYGHLLKAQLLEAKHTPEIYTDSIVTQINRLEADAAKADQSDQVLAAVYHCVLGAVWMNGYYMPDSAAVKSRTHYKLALAHPDLLAQTKASGYVPLVTMGSDSRLFAHDMLSVIAMQTEDYKTAHDYYATHYNRAATMYMALLDLKKARPAAIDNWRKSTYVAKLDSLIDCYQDLPECGEVAIERYQYASSCLKTSNAERIGWINTALEKWGSWPNMNTLRNAKAGLTASMASIELERTTTSTVRPLWAKLNVRNAGRVSVTTTRLNVDGADYGYDRNLNDDDFDKLKAKLEQTTARTVVRNYAGLPDYMEKQDSVELRFDRTGVYLVQVSSDRIEGQTDRMLCYVTNLFVLNQAIAKNKIRYAVVDAATGQPVAGANLRLFYRKMGPSYPARTINLTTDKKGEAIYQSTGERNTPDYISASTATDKAFPKSRSYTYFSKVDRQTKSSNILLFTDRSIYRPGQTVHVAVVGYDQDDLVLTPMAGKQMRLVLTNSNGKEVTAHEVTTDDFGTASADFSLPASGINGYYTIAGGTNSHRGSCGFTVAEYKRPTFEVTLPEVKEKYQVGDTVVVTGTAKTYAGIPVGGAKVTYRVSRQERLFGWWWRGDFGKYDNDFAHGEATTDAEGRFTMELPMELPDAVVNDPNRRFFNIIAQAKVTDAQGETHEAELLLPLGMKATCFTSSLPDRVLADSLATITFRQTNMAGLKIDAPVAYAIDGNHAAAQTNIPVALDGLKLTSGEHKLWAVCGTDTIETTFVVFRLDDRRPPVTTKDWTYVTSNQFADADTPVYLQLGTSYKNVHVFYTLHSEKGLLESGTLELSDSLYTRRFNYDSSYGDELLYNYAWVRDGKMYAHTMEIRRPLPDKRLVMKWSTFRDRLTPGQKEEWRLNITTPDGKPAKAQLLSVLYDKSLDQITPHSWNLGVGFPSIFFHAPWQSIRNRSNGLYISKDITWLKNMAPDFTQFERDLLRWMVVGYVGSAHYEPETIAGNTIRYKGTMDKVSTGSVLMSRQNVVAAEAPVVRGMAKAESRDGGMDAASEASTKELPVRTNLQETAFFYPNLVTDGKGDVNIRFTLPESVTTWRFMGLAHDKSMCNASIQGEVVAQKAIMIQPNMPRFLRKGDKANIAARISNTTDKTISGKAQLIISDPETGKTLARQTLDFKAESNAAQSVAFPVDVDELTDEARTVLVCKVTAEANGCSDGEQHYLPILENTQQVVNTLPFCINGSGEKTVDLGSLTDGMKNVSRQKLTVEYADNPAWMMVQSLPSLQVKDSKNAIELSGAFFANALASRMAACSPRIKDVVAQWQKEDGKDRSNNSPLQNNQELKDLLLAESPWTAQADNEAEQRRQIAELFDENVIVSRQQTIFKQLMDLQNFDGSFSWYPGMQGSPYVTADVALTLVRLDLLTAGNVEGDNDEFARFSKHFKSNAINYLLGDMVKTVDRMKREEEKGHKQTAVDYEQLVQLYIFALSHPQMNAKQKEAQNYLMHILLSQPALKDIRSKAVAAVVFARTGHMDKAKEYVKSIKEFTVYTDQMGRYFDGSRVPYYWCDYRMPAQVAAVEALKLVTPDDQSTITEMQRWILQQKHAQRWDSPVIGIEAVYAFFVPKAGEQPNLDILAPCEKAQLFVDGKRLNTNTPTAGIGYVKVELDKANAKTLTVKKQHEGISWGAVYLTATQPMEDIKASASGLNVKREVIGAKNLKVGDRVKVRFTIKADRDYDFVQLHDRRPACLEPVEQTSGYRGGCYVDVKDASTRFYMDHLCKGKTEIETEYYIDRPGDYQAGAATVQCAYAPEFAGHDKGNKVIVEE